MIAVVNKVQSNPLNSRHFKQLGDELKRHLLCTEVGRLFTKTATLASFHSLTMSSVDLSLAKKLAVIKPRVVYLVDFFAELTNRNIQLQGDEINTITPK